MRFLFTRQGVCHGLQSSFCHRVHPEPRIEILGRNRRDHDHVTPGRCPHVRHQRAAEIDRPPDVDTQETLPLLVRRLRDMRTIDGGRTQARVVDQRINLAKVADGRLAHANTRVLVPHVCLVDLRPASLAADNLRHLGSCFGVAGVVDGDVRAFRCESLNDCPADAATATRNKGCPTRQPSFAIAHTHPQISQRAG